MMMVFMGYSQQLIIIMWSVIRWHHAHTTISSLTRDFGKKFSLPINFQLNIILNSFWYFHAWSLEFFKGASVLPRLATHIWKWTEANLQKENKKMYYNVNISYSTEYWDGHCTNGNWHELIIQFYHNKVMTMISFLNNWY